MSVNKYVQRGDVEEQSRKCRMEDWGQPRSRKSDDSDAGNWRGVSVRFGEWEEKFVDSPNNEYRSRRQRQKGTTSTRRTLGDGDEDILQLGSGV